MRATIISGKCYSSLLHVILLLWWFFFLHYIKTIPEIRADPLTCLVVVGWVGTSWTTSQSLFLWCMFLWWFKCGSSLWSYTLIFFGESTFFFWEGARYWLRNYGCTCLCQKSAEIQQISTSKALAFFDKTAPRRCALASPRLYVSLLKYYYCSPILFLVTPLWKRSTISGVFLCRTFYADRGWTSCRAGRANVPPDFDSRGENRSLPSHFSMASLPEFRLKFGVN